MITITESKGGYVELAGSSRDDKPTEYAGGSLFMETDTGNIYVFDADSETWTQLGG